MCLHHSLWSPHPMACLCSHNIPPIAFKLTPPSLKHLPFLASIQHKLLAWGPPQSLHLHGSFAGSWCSKQSLPAAEPQSSALPPPFFSVCKLFPIPWFEVVHGNDSQIRISSSDVPPGFQPYSCCQKPCQGLNVCDLPPIRVLKSYSPT